MNLLNEDNLDDDEDFSALSFRSKRKNLRVLEQVKEKGIDIERDRSRKALMPGKRISKNGNTYWETRSSRSDNKGSNL